MSPRDHLAASIRSLLDLVETHELVPQEEAEDAIKEIRVYLAACVIVPSPRSQPGVSAGTYESAREIYR